jgi:inner membrane protein
MPALNGIKDTSNRIGQSVTFKLVTISILILVLLLPASMVKSLIREREARKYSVINEVNDKWGQGQIVVGPIISVPYLKQIVGKNRKTTTVTKYLHILPDIVNIQSHITPEIRYRGIYEVVLYNTTICMDGSFPRIPIEELRIPPENIVWPGAFISFGISDMRGIKASIDGTFDGKPLSMEPGIETADVLQSGVSVGIALDGTHKLRSFKFDFNLNGSGRIHFAPVGKVTTVTARSRWKDPSFDGAFLPAERSVTEKGFSAKWRVLHLNRNYPQYWKGNGCDLSLSTFGVALISPVDVYQKTTRIAKYALMFIVFAFLPFFISEILGRLRVHPVQYLLIGLGIIIFYTLLLSISEQVNFGAAYLISAGAIICLIAGYAKAISKNRNVSLMVGGILAVLYAYLYLLLQLEDNALLMGSVGLFAVLSIIMYLTRKIDWYGLQQGALKSSSAKPLDRHAGNSD